MDEITEEKENNAIDLVIALTVEEIAGIEQRDQSDVLPEFLSSRTAQMLYDRSTKLWWDGPSSIAERYMIEKANNH
ncbi:MAG: hypothetical protein IJI57_06910 [Flexilinea sp.]|nr:hypothetical protein [Flexilinea sp.]